MYTGLPPYMQNRASCSVRPPGSAPNGIVTDDASRAGAGVAPARAPKVLRAHGAPGNLSDPRTVDVRSFAAAPDDVEPGRHTKLMPDLADPQGSIGDFGSRRRSST